MRALPLNPGDRIGEYRIVGALGAGGMGEVYRARDDQLNRDVAVKVLRADVATDAERLQRFVREAQTLAALNHPNIAQIYGVAGGGQALVMELVEGEDLAQRLARGPIPIDEASAIARQIADALEAAHELGIVHRDLKPANIKLRADGTVKVLDFGLAKALDPSRSSAGDVLNSPTITSPAMTQAGIILGTAAYMSPEQARGKPVDRRADIWAFGTVLFEMLTGERPFAGDTVTDVIAAVVTKSPDWSALPKNTPPAIVHLLRRCLEKDARVRLRDIGEARVVLSSSNAATVVPESPAAAFSRIRVLARVLPWAVAAIAIGVAVAAWLLNVNQTTAVRKIEVAMPADVMLVTLSPDGSQIAFRSQNQVRVKDLRTLETRDVAAAPLTQANLLAWSPDSRSLVYNTVDSKLWRVSAGGGPPQLIADVPETGQAFFAVWREDGSIVLSVWRGGLYSVPASGGAPVPIVAIDPTSDIDFHFPVALPDGRIMVATHLLQPVGGSPNAFRIEIVGEGSRVPIVPAAGFYPLRYLDSGHVLVQRFDVNEGLWKVPFRPNEPLDIADGELVAAGASSISVSDDGLLLYAFASGDDLIGEMVWVDRGGRISGQVGVEQKLLSGPALSPDQRQVAFSAAAGGNTDIWIRDLHSNLQSRVTSEGDHESEPAWFPLAERLAYREMPMGIITPLASRIAARKRDGADRAELTRGIAPTFSPDGKFFLFLVDHRGSLRLRYAPIKPDGTFGTEELLIKTEPEPVITAAAVAPSGNLIAYVEPHPGGRPEVYVTRFPRPEGRWQVSVNGGRAPVWSRNGELFFVGGANTGPKQMMAVQIELGGTAKASTPLKLFDIPGELQTTPRIGGKAMFDVTADGKQFLMVRNRAEKNDLATRWILVENWPADLSLGSR